MGLLREKSVLVTSAHLPGCQGSGESLPTGGMQGPRHASETAVPRRGPQGQAAACEGAAPQLMPFLFAFAGQRIVNRLRTSLFSSVLRQEVAFFDKTRTGELINRLSSDTALLGRSVTENLSDGLRAGAQASVGIGMMVCWPARVVPSSQGFGLCQASQS